jgi:hypothetical protein
VSKELVRQTKKLQGSSVYNWGVSHILKPFPYYKPSPSFTKLLQLKTLTIKLFSFQSLITKTSKLRSSSNSGIIAQLIIRGH